MTARTEITSREWLLYRQALVKLTPDEQRAVSAVLCKMHAQWVAGFDNQVAHPWRFSECLLTKFNAFRGKARRNRHPTAEALTTVYDAMRSL